MTKGQQTLIIVLTSILIGGGIIWAGVSYWIQGAIESGAESIAEGKKYGNDTDEAGCVDRALQRNDACSGIGCQVQNAVFLSGCLDTSARAPEFCDSVPETSAIMDSVTWRLQQCDQAGRTDSSCPQLFSAVQTHCHNRGTENQGS